MTPALLRHLWQLVEQANPQVLARLDDSSLARWIVEQLADRQELSPQQAAVVDDYISRRVALVRDLASQHF